MNILTTSIYEQNADAWLHRRKTGIRRTCNEGGTSSSKTYSILQLIVLISQHARKPLLSSVVSESLPHLKRGCIRDFKNILGDDFEAARYNKSENIYRFGNGIVEFFPADDPAKMRGGRRDILFINEANNVSYDSYRELDIRTERFTFLDWNPVSEFWVHEHGIADEPTTSFIHSTYLDAIHVLPETVVANIEEKKDKDPNWWRVYGQGLLGKIEGLVYPNFKQVKELPKGDTFYGLDFGFTNDPAVLVKNVIVGDDLYSQQMFWEYGKTNDELARKMELLGIRKNNDEIFADAAEPKSIEEISRKGYNIKPCEKGPGSVEYGIQKVNQLNQYWTEDSLDCIKEQRNFRYIQDKNGNYTEKTMHQWSHGMDARRYALSTHIEVVGGSHIHTYIPLG